MQNLEVIGVHLCLQQVMQYIDLLDALTKYAQGAHCRQRRYVFVERYALGLSLLKQDETKSFSYRFVQVSQGIRPGETPQYCGILSNFRVIRLCQIQCMKCLRNHFLTSLSSISRPIIPPTGTLTTSFSPPSASLLPLSVAPSHRAS